MVITSSPHAAAITPRLDRRADCRAPGPLGTMSVRGRSTRRRSSMALLSLLAGAPLVASSAWVQDRFAISFWVR